MIRLIKNYDPRYANPWKLPLILTDGAANVPVQFISDEADTLAGPNYSYYGIIDLIPHKLLEKLFIEYCINNDFPGRRLSGPAKITPATQEELGKDWK